MSLMEVKVIYKLELKLMLLRVCHRQLFMCLQTQQVILAEDLTT